MSDENKTPAEDETDATPADHGDDEEPAAATDDDGEEPERLYTKADVDALLRESQDRMLRVMAEYDNFRRRTAREKEQWIADALENFVKHLLPVFDSFDKARESGSDDEAAATAMKEGLEVTHKQLRGVLDSYSIEVIDPKGEAFDPTYHEALMRQPSPDHEPGTVVTVFERGYKLGPRLLRAARTVVAAEA
jgi:molecular chaperone GrpE